MTDIPVSPLRRGMIEDMTICKFAPKTQASYIRAVRNFTVLLGRSPDQASAEDLRRYQLRLAATCVMKRAFGAKQISRLSTTRQSFRRSVALPRPQPLCAQLGGGAEPHSAVF
jgi:hypothetical protein